MPRLLNGLRHLVWIQGDAGSIYSGNIYSHFEFSLVSFSSQLRGAHVNDTKYDLLPAVYIVLDPRYDESHKIYAYILPQYNFYRG